MSKAGTMPDSLRFLLQRALGLSQQQRQEIVQLRRLFLSKMNSIVQQRCEIHQTLAVRSSSQFHGLSN